MEKVKGTGKRGRPRKNPIKLIETGPKRKRGRPSKSGKKIIEGSENIIITPTEEIYIEPKLLRKKRVFRFDKSLFHNLSHKMDGDIIKVSYVVSELMRLYTENKLKIDEKSYSTDYYNEWCKGNPPLEPLIINSISQENAVLRGIPLQYKYPIIIDEFVFSAFEASAIGKRFYPPFVSNKLLQMYLDENNKLFMDRHIHISKADLWCKL